MCNMLVYRHHGTSYSLGKQLSQKMEESVGRLAGVYYNSIGSPSFNTNSLISNPSME